MPETLLTNSSIKLYGRVMIDLAYNDKSLQAGYNNFLQQQLSGKGSASFTGTTTAGDGTISSVSSLAGLRRGMGVSTTTAGALANNSVIVSVKPAASSFEIDPPAKTANSGISFTASLDPVFARIYAFTFQGAVYNLPKPTIFLVHGPGFSIDSNPRTNVEQSGVAAREWEFSGAGNNRDLAYWEYEKGDFSIRLDSEAGPFEEILLAAALRAGADMADRSGASLGIRSGASLAGASLSGASLSGASVSGASLSGASLSGASLRTNR